MNLAPDERLVFLHLRKCGGTTLHRFLSHHFRPEEICPERFNALRDIPGERRNAYRFFSAHLSWNSLQLIPGPKRIFTFMRDPRARWESHYRFWNAHRDAFIHAHRLAPLQWVKERSIDRVLDELPQAPGQCLYELDNHITRILLGQEGFDLLEPLARRHDADTLVEKAAARLDQLFLVGFVEDFDNSLQHLCRALQIDYPGTLKPLNTAEQYGSHRTTQPVSVPPLTPEQAQRLEAFVALDRKLYETARRRV